MSADNNITINHTTGNTDNSASNPLPQSPYRSDLFGSVEDLESYISSLEEEVAALKAGSISSSIPVFPQLPINPYPTVNTVQPTSSPIVEPKPEDAIGNTDDRYSSIVRNEAIPASFQPPSSAVSSYDPHSTTPTGAASIPQSPTAHTDISHAARPEIEQNRTTDAGGYYAPVSVAPPAVPTPQRSEYPIYSPTYQPPTQPQLPSVGVPPQYVERSPQLRHPSSDIWSTVSPVEPIATVTSQVSTPNQSTVTTPLDVQNRLGITPPQIGPTAAGPASRTSYDSTQTERQTEYYQPEQPSQPQIVQPKPVTNTFPESTQSAYIYPEQTDFVPPQPPSIELPSAPVVQTTYPDRFIASGQYFQQQQPERIIERAYEPENHRFSFELVDDEQIQDSISDIPATSIPMYTPSEYQSTTPGAEIPTPTSYPQSEAQPSQPHFAPSHIPQPSTPQPVEQTTVPAAPPMTPESNIDRSMSQLEQSFFAPDITVQPTALKLQPTETATGDLKLSQIDSDSSQEKAVEPPTYPIPEVKPAVKMPYSYTSLTQNSNISDAKDNEIIGTYPELQNKPETTAPSSSYPGILQPETISSEKQPRSFSQQADMLDIEPEDISSTVLEQPTEPIRNDLQPQIPGPVSASDLDVFFGNDRSDTTKSTGFELPTASQTVVEDPTVHADLREEIRPLAWQPMENDTGSITRFLESLSPPIADIKPEMITGQNVPFTVDQIEYTQPELSEANELREANSPRITEPRNIEGSVSQVASDFVSSLNLSFEPQMVDRVDEAAVFPLPEVQYPVGQPVQEDFTFERTEPEETQTEYKSEQMFFGQETIRELTQEQLPDSSATILPELPETTVQPSSFDGFTYTPQYPYEHSEGVLEVEPVAQPVYDEYSLERTVPVDIPTEFGYGQPSIGLETPSELMVEKLPDGFAVIPDQPEQLVQPSDFGGYTYTPAIIDKQPENRVEVEPLLPEIQPQTFAGFEYSVPSVLTSDIIPEPSEFDVASVGDLQLPEPQTYYAEPPLETASESVGSSASDRFAVDIQAVLSLAEATEQPYPTQNEYQQPPVDVTDKEDKESNNAFQVYEIPEQLTITPDFHMPIFGSLSENIDRPIVDDTPLETVDDYVSDEPQQHDTAETTIESLVQSVDVLDSFEFTPQNIDDATVTDEFTAEISIAPEPEIGEYTEPRYISYYEDDFSDMDNTVYRLQAETILAEANFNYSNNNMFNYPNRDYIKFNNVTSVYNMKFQNGETRPLFQDISISVPRGSCTAFISNTPLDVHALLRAAKSKSGLAEGRITIGGRNSVTSQK
ncbi:MAG: hypothetical protein FWG21_03910, partial [Oscillospiraceae bacterium]|nr:hypothetical protein [Oscillospiraceae bacterium]